MRRGMRGFEKIRDLVQQNCNENNGFHVMSLSLNGADVHYVCRAFDEMRQKPRKIFPVTRVLAATISSPFVHFDVRARARIERKHTLRTLRMTEYTNNGRELGSLSKSGMPPLRFAVKLIFS